MARRQWGRLSLLNAKITPRFRAQNLVKDTEVSSENQDKRKVSKQKRKIAKEDTEVTDYLSQKAILDRLLNTLNSKKLKLQNDRDFIIQKL